MSGVVGYPDDDKSFENSDAFDEWANTPTLEMLKDDYNNAEQEHTAHMQRVDKWRTLMKAPPIKGDSNKGCLIQPKLVRKQAEWRYPALSEPFLNNDKIISASPVTWEDRDRQEQVELLLNHQWETSVDRVSFIDKYVRCLVDDGTAILRTGWEYVEQIITKPMPVYSMSIDPSMMQLLADITKLEMESPAEYSYQVDDGLKQAHQYYKQVGLPVRPTVIGYEDTEVVEVIHDRPTVEICDIANVVIDPSCEGDPSKAKFFVNQFQTCLAELTSQGIYHNLDAIDVDNTINEGPGGVDQPDFNFSDDSRKLFTAHEYWGYLDIDDDGVLQPCVITWVGSVMIRREVSPYPGNSLPFIVVPYLPMTDSVYGEADGELLEDNQKITGAVTRGMIDLMAKSANSQTGTRRGALDPTNLRKFYAGEDYEYNTQTDPRTLFYMHQFPEIPNSAPQILQQQAMEAESITGVKSFSQGISGNSLGDVATGVTGALDAAGKRETAILRRLVSGITQVCNHWLAMDSEFLDEAQVVRITNEQYVTLDKDDVQGRFDIKLTVSTAEEDNAKASELAFMLQTIGNNAPVVMTQKILGEICKLRRMPDLAKEIIEYQPEPDPLEQQIKMEQLRQLQMQNIEIQSKAIKNSSASELDKAKAIQALANASNTQSQTDLSNLDFLEQESGVTQARNMQLQQAQASANMQLETHKAQLNEKAAAKDRLREYYGGK